MQAQNKSIEISIAPLEIEEQKMSDFATDSNDGKTFSKVMSASCSTCVCTAAASFRSKRRGN